MPRFAHPPTGGQETDPSEPRPYARCPALMLSREEAQRVRTATRKVAHALGGFKALAARLDVPVATVHGAANPRQRPTGIFAIRLAAAAGVPVEVLLGGKVVVAHVIGVAA